MSKNKENIIWGAVSLILFSAVVIGSCMVAWG